MNVLLISQCHKNALKETRRILDRFAERCGERTWQTAITAEGLDTLHTLLRRSARKNTAVACHRLSGKNHSELLWVVGGRSQFNRQGRVPTHRSSRNIVRKEDEHGWVYGRSIQIVAVLAALLHDLGKATHGFQDKLRHAVAKGDPYRHEWYSLQLFRCMIDGCGSDTEWLERLHNWSDYCGSHPDWHHSFSLNNHDFSTFPPLARWIAWLIVSHHRLPVLKLDGSAYRRESLHRLQQNQKIYSQSAGYWYGHLYPTHYWVCNPKAANSAAFRTLQDDPTAHKIWQKQLKRWCGKALNHAPLLELAQSQPDITDPLLLHLSRLCLMMGDHHYSSLPPRSHERLNGSWRPHPVANTDRSTGQIKQSLDEHLCGVAACTARFSRLLPLFSRQLPTLRDHRPFRKNTRSARFQWQNRAAEMAESLQTASEQHGFFGVNLAGTGCGKTLGNARIMSALSDAERGTRLTIALGLRTLTLQTGAALREKLSLKNSQLATLVGGSAVRDLFETAPNGTQNNGEDEEYDDPYGSYSAEPLLDESCLLDGTGSLNADELGVVIADPKARQLLLTPLISCTIDHLMPVSEQRRGGRHIVPTLRLLSSDLILDEPDDFNTDDLPALSRLVYWAGLLGSRVLLSSATLTPDFCTGLFRAYHDGRRIFNRHCGLPEAEPVAAWFDEFDCVSHHNTDEQLFGSIHQDFCRRRSERLDKQAIRRRAEWLAADAQPAVFAPRLLDGIIRLHHRHALTLPNGKTASIGLVRFANINPLTAHMLALLQQTPPDDTRLHIACYHGRQLLMLRNRLEETLDRLLQRGQDEAAVFRQPETAAALHNYPEKHHIFIIFGSPVTEVGRDHDYDWAIVEPSSLRSLVQLAGRVWRHRPEKTADSANILILEKNINHLCNKLPAYTQPGFESRHLCRLDKNHALPLFPDSLTNHIHAAARLLRPTITVKLNNQSGERMVSNLTVLEHAVTTLLLNPKKQNHITAYRHAGTVAMLTTHFSAISPFRHGRPQQDYVVLPHPYQNEAFSFKTCEQMKYAPDEYSPNENHLFHLTDEPEHHPRICLWLNYGYQDTLTQLAARMGDDDMLHTAERFAVVSLDTVNGVGRENLWHFHPWIGFWRPFQAA